MLDVHKLPNFWDINLRDDAPILSEQRTWVLYSCEAEASKVFGFSGEYAAMAVTLPLNSWYIASLDLGSIVAGASPFFEGSDPQLVLGSYDSSPESSSRVITGVFAQIFGDSIERCIMPIHHATYDFDGMQEKGGVYIELPGVTDPNQLNNKQLKDMKTILYYALHRVTLGSD